MLIVLNILIILFLLAMVAIWATYGFFSAFLHLMIVIVSGTFAFAIWEPLSFWLLGRMPGTAWGVGLLVPFALSIVVLRILMDKYCKMNLHFPRLADQIGGAACGLGAGVLTGGMLLIGAGFLMPTTFMGYQPYRMTGVGIEPNEEGQLWGVTRIDQWAGGFYSTLSAGSMKPWSGTSLAVYKSDIADRAQIYHLTNDPNQFKAAPPKAVTLLDAHLVSGADFRDMVVLASYDALLSGQIDLNQVDLDARARAEANPNDPTVGPDAFGAHYVDAILAEFDRRKRENEQNPPERMTVEVRPTGILDVPAILALAELFEPPAPAAGVSNASRDLDGDGEEDGVDPEGEDATPAAGAGSPLSDLISFFDDVTQKQVRPTVEALQRVVREGSNVVIIDTQWSRKPPGAFDEDGWVRIAMPSIRLVTVSGGEDPEYKSVAPIGYAREINQDTGRRTYVDLQTQRNYSADEQIDDVKLAWVFVLPPGHTPFRFEARQLGFDLEESLAGEPAQFVELARLMGPIDVPEQIAPPEGIQIGRTGAVVRLGERLPRSLSPNAATAIEPNKEDDPWTAFQGEQRSILPQNSGGRRSQMRNVTAPEGSRIIQIVVTPESDQALLGDARQGLKEMYVRDDSGVEHVAIGFALYRPDSSMHLALRSGAVPASRLPRIGTGETLTIYFQVPEGVTVTEFLYGDKDSEGVEFGESIRAEAR